MGKSLGSLDVAAGAAALAEPLALVFHPLNGALPFSLSSDPWPIDQDATTNEGNLIVSLAPGAAQPAAFFSDGTLWRSLTPTVFSGYVSGGTPAAITGATTETAGVSVLIPGGLVGPNGRVKARATASCSANTNSKALNIRISPTAGAGGTVLANNTTTSATVQSMLLQTEFRNRNSQASQGAETFGNGLTTTSGSALAATAVNTANDWYLNFTGTLGNAADTIQFDSWVVEIWRN